MFASTSLMEQLDLMLLTTVFKILYILYSDGHKATRELTQQETVKLS